MAASDNFARIENTNRKKFNLKSGLKALHRYVNSSLFDMKKYHPKRCDFEKCLTSDSQTPSVAVFKEF